MRVLGWEARLDAVLKLYRQRPFAWGSSDCLMLAADVVDAVRGDDPAAKWRGTYDDENGAARILLSLGVRDAPAAVALYCAARPLALARRGDLAVIREPASDDPLGAIGVVVGALVAGYGPDGLAFVPRGHCSRAFEVG